MKYTRFIFKHLDLGPMALFDGCACKKIFFGNPKKNYRYMLGAKSLQITKIQAHD